jgi:uncharacterized membrane protein
MFVSSLLTPAREAHSRSFAKAVSWRITGSIDTFVLSLIITRSFTLAGSIASIEVITKIFLYYLHERAWGLVPWGRSCSPALANAERAYDGP